MRSSGKCWEKPRPRRAGATVPAKGRERGAILLMLIVTMIVVSILGAGMWYLNTAATDSQMLANNQAKAVWLAQSGIEYATPIVAAAQAAGQTTPITDLNNRTFTLSDGNTFYLRTDNSNVDYTVIESTGIVNPNSKLQAMQKKVVQMVRGIGASAGVANRAIQSHADLVLENDAYVDSYDSRLAPWTFATHRLNGTVATNSVQNDKLQLRGHTDVYGNLVVGPGGNPAAVIKKDSGATYTGTATASTFAAAMMPVNDPGGGTPVTVANGLTLTAGTYRSITDNVDLKSTWVVTISGAVTLIVNNDFKMQDSAQINIQPGGSLTVIAMHNISIRDNAVLNGSGTPAQCNIRAHNDVVLDHWAKVVGIVFAPGRDRHINMQKDTSVFGGIYAYKVSMKDRAAIHYDEALAGTTSSGVPVVSY